MLILLETLTVTPQQMAGTLFAANLLVLVMAEHALPRQIKVVKVIQILLLIRTIHALYPDKIAALNQLQQQPHLAEQIQHQLQLQALINAKAEVNFMLLVLKFA